jgi:hypothetical protein
MDSWNRIETPERSLYIYEHLIFFFFEIGPHCFGIDNPPVLKTDTQETENLDKSIFS